MAGSQAVPVVMTAWSWQQAAGDRDAGLGVGELVVGSAGQVRVPGGEHGLFRNAAHTARQAARRSWGRPLMPVLPW
jgi:hypothetical protein